MSFKKACFAFLLSAQGIRAGDRTPQPNIILIMADDLGWSDLGCYGGEIDTPHLDKLAAEGLRFTQFYTSSKCEPTRASVLSGQYWQHTGAGLKEGITMGQALQGAGYATFAIGKWHLLGNPVDRGFNRYFGHLGGASDYFKGHSSHHLDDQPYQPDSDSFYTTDANADFAIKFLEESRRNHPDQPFFLYLAFNAPHSPLQAWPEDIAKYRGRYRAGWDELRQQRYRRMIESGVFQGKWPLPPRPDTIPAWDSLTETEKDFEDMRMATYAAMVDRMDQAIGRLLASVRARGEEENTMVLFMSDNGASPFDRLRRGRFYQEGNAMPDPNAMWQYGLGWAHVSSAPFQHYKRNMFNGGMVAPLIVYWPAGLSRKGSVTDHPAHIIDLMPTFLEAAGGSLPRSFEGKPLRALPGKNLLPLFQGGEPEPHEALYFQNFDHRAVISGGWKLVSDWGRSWALFNLDEDRTEMNDLSVQMPEQYQRLEGMWDDWWKAFRGGGPFLTPGRSDWGEPSYRHLGDRTEDTQGRIR